jgi:hypothetical protein
MTMVDIPSPSPFGAAMHRARDRGHSGAVPLLRLGPVSVPSPEEVVDTTRSVLGWGGEVVALGASLPSRVDALIVEVERLVAVLGRITERVDGLIDRADTLVAACDGVVDTARTITASATEVVESSRGITAGATEVVELSRGITTGATEVVELSRTLTSGAGEVMERAGVTSTAAQELLDLYRPMLERGAPLAGRFVDDLTPEEIDAAIKLVDQLPVLTQHMVSDIMPILETLDRVGPDISELLGVTKDLRQGIAGIPGLSFFVKRGADKDDKDD